MNDHYDDEHLGQRVRDSVERRADRISARPDADDLFARVGARAARQRRSLATVGVVLVAVASLVGYTIGSTGGGDGPSNVNTPVAGPSDANASPTPEPEDVATPPLEHLFTRTVGEITVRAYITPESPDEPAASRFIVAEMSNDAAVGIGRAELCAGGGAAGASGTFGGPEGSPVQWTVVDNPYVPPNGEPVLARFAGGEDSMVPVRGLAVLVAPGDGDTVWVEGPAGGGSRTIGAPAGCPPAPVPATLPPGGAQPADVAAAEAAVRQAYVEVYDDHDPATTEERVRQALRANGFTDEQLADMTVEVGEIRFTDETHAAVLFRLTIPGHGTAEWRLGYAVLQDGRWTQAEETRCEHIRSLNLTCP